MKKQLRIVLAGVLVIAPFAVTVWAVWWLGGSLDAMVLEPLAGKGIELFPGAGVLIVLAAVYLMGLFAQLWIFRWMFRLLEVLFVRVPGIKTIYESVRDLLMLFGGDAQKMGKVVMYCLPGTQMTVLGIRTNDRPRGGQQAPGDSTAAVYLPFSYMFGGVTIFVPAEQLIEVDMPVETCLKLCATAFVTRDLSDDLKKQADRREADLETRAVENNPTEPE